jgi:hypothetical protein
VQDDHDFVLIDQDFTKDIEDYYYALEAQKETDIRFLSLQNRIGAPRIAELISFLESGPPEVAGSVVEMLDFSTDSLNNIAAMIDKVRMEVTAGKAMKAFSVETHFGGLSYVAVREYHEGALQLAETVGRRHKYNLKKDRWYVLLDYVGSDTLIDAVFPIWERWEQSNDLDEAMKDVDQVLKTSFEAFKRDQSS